MTAQHPCHSTSSFVVLFECGNNPPLPEERFLSESFHLQEFDQRLCSARERIVPPSPLGPARRRLKNLPFENHGRSVVIHRMVRFSVSNVSFPVRSARAMIKPERGDIGCRLS